MLTETLVTALMIDGSEGRDIATTNIVIECLNANMDDLMEMKIEEMMVEFMIKAYPEKYSKHAYMYTNKKVLYVKIVKEFYGCIKAGLL